MFDNKELTITNAEYVPARLNDNKYSLYLDFSDGTYLFIDLSGAHDNQVIDMTKADTEEWYWVFRYSDAEYNSIIYGDGEIDINIPCDAGSTMKVRCLNKETPEFEVEFKVIKDGHTMNGFYKGTFKPVEEK